MQTLELSKVLVTPLQTMAYLRDLDQNNNREWFARNRSRYDAELVAPLKALLGDLTPTLFDLNSDLETSYKVNTTVMRINRDLRFNPQGAPYRNYVKASFPLRGFKWSTDPVFGFGIFPDYFYVAFRNAGQQRKDFVAVYRQNMARYPQLVERWIKLADAPRYLSVLGGEHDDIQAMEPAPSTVEHWRALEEPTIGHIWTLAELRKLGAAFVPTVIDRMVRLYFLKLLAIDNSPEREAQRYFRLLQARGERQPARMGRRLRSA